MTCVCGHLKHQHRQYDDGEYCFDCGGSCQEYRKAAPEDRSLSAGVTPEGLARETVEAYVDSVNAELQGLIYMPPEATADDVKDHRRTCVCGHRYHVHAVSGPCLAADTPPGQVTGQGCQCHEWSPQ